MISPRPQSSTIGLLRRSILVAERITLLRIPTRRDLRRLPPIPGFLL
jgi:hypothetical protein